MSFSFTIWGANSSSHYKKVHQSGPHMLIWTPSPYNFFSALLTEVFLLGSFTPIPETPLTVRTPTFVARALRPNAQGLNPHSPQVASRGGPHWRRKDVSPSLGHSWLPGGQSGFAGASAHPSQPPKTEPGKTASSASFCSSFLMWLCWNGHRPHAAPFLLCLYF